MNSEKRIPWCVSTLPLGASTGAALVLVLIGQTLKPGGNLLLGLDHNVQQVFGYVAVFVVKERRGQTCTIHSKIIHSYQNIICSVPLETCLGPVTGADRAPVRNMMDEYLITLLIHCIVTESHCLM